MTIRPLILALLSSVSMWAATPRVALLCSDHGNFRHRNDYNKVMKRLGWNLTPFENRDVKKLVERLGEFDIVLGGALFNYSNPQPLGEYGPALLEFVAKGGAIVLTDLNYPQHLNWLKQLGEGSEVSLVPQDAKTHPTTWLDRGHILYCQPHRVSLGGTWMGLRPGPAWTVMAKGKDGAATALYQSHGNGFLYVGCHWPAADNLLRNVWAGLQLHRNGLVPHFPETRQLDLGTEELVFSARNTTAKTQPIAMKVRLELGGHTQDIAFPAADVEPGKLAEFRAKPGKLRRGAYSVHAEFLLNGQSAYAGEVMTGSIPDLLTTDVLHPYPRTKPLLYAEAMPEELLLRNRLHPEPGQDIHSLTVHLRLVDGKGTASQIVVPSCSENDFRSQLRVPRALVPPVTIQQEVRQGATLLQASQVAVEIVPPHRPSVVVKPDLGLLVNGKPFFPIGAYHVSNKDLPKARELGFNCHQAWGSNPKQARENLDAARDNDMMVLLEMSSYLRNGFRQKELGEQVDQLKDHPALLTWYTIDEPHGDMQCSWARQSFADIVARDPYHPVYLVMCDPGSFDRFGPTTDILAVDPYPIPRQGVGLVTSWMKRAQRAVQDSKPIWMIPQLHNWAAYRKEKNGRAPTPEELRNMTYQSLVWGAKGVIYYPWDDRVTGLVHEPALMKSIGGLNAELAAIGPDLVAAQRTLLADGDGEPFVAAAFRLEGRTLVLATNLTDKPTAISLPVPGNTIEGKFAAPAATLTNGALAASLPALDVGVWELR